MHLWVASFRECYMIDASENANTKRCGQGTEA
eukprot:COSAG04_NODE_15991_length_513_cov_0.879227_1_plen_31_part_10